MVLGLRRRTDCGHPLKRTPNGTLTENPLSQSSLASRLSQELFSQIDLSAFDGLLDQLDPSALAQLQALLASLELKLPE